VRLACTPRRILQEELVTFVALLDLLDVVAGDRTQLLNSVIFFLLEDAACLEIAA